jgi:5-formaminoimidazole-4-carboxamide-1-(beta)-D-ribofuranosyl 5'-monophosphate synthetase
MTLTRDEMQELVKTYQEPIGLNLGSHSALDAWHGQRTHGFRSIIYVTPQRARIYLHNTMVGEANETFDDLPAKVKDEIIVVNDPKDIQKTGTWKSAILILDKYSDIMQYIDDLRDLECIQIPNRAFAVYVGGDEACSVIENEFAVPILGSRNLLKIENRGEIDRDYYWFAEKAGIPYPASYPFTITKTGIRLTEAVDSPLLLKAKHAVRSLEREFIFAADSTHLEEKVEREVEAGNLNREGLESARIEQIVLGPHANFNFFFSPLNARADWGSVDTAYAAIYQASLPEARVHLANEFLSIDERRETILDGVKRMPIDVQERLHQVPSFEVTCHLAMSLRESLLKDVHKYADAFLLATRKYAPPGIIGAWCLQTLITWAPIPGSAVEFGLYDVPEGKAGFMHIPYTQDVALRHGGGTNVHMGVGSQYANARYRRVMSMGDRIALELKRAQAKNRLAEIVT